MKTLSYRLTAERIAAHAGGPVVCLDASAQDRVFRLYAERPGAALNRFLTSADIVDSAGVINVMPDESDDAEIVRVDIRGPIEQRGSLCESGTGWTEGYDTITEKMLAAIEQGDVLLVIDSPGGAVAGLQEAVKRISAAKEAAGRRVTVYADELVASAAFWLAACIGDEIYLPEAGQIGSIGARGAHGSIAGALAKEGVEVTFFCWPSAGKVAMAAELPLSDIGRERGERDVAISGEAFCAAVCEARGLDPQAIVDLEADVLTGWAAVEAGLADGVGSLEDAIGYALVASAKGTEEANDMLMKAAVNRAHSVTSGARASVASAKKPDESKPGDNCVNCGAPTTPDAKFCIACGASTVPVACEACGTKNGPEAAFCKKCGASVKDDAPPDSDPAPAPGQAPPPPAKPAPPAAAGDVAITAWDRDVAARQGLTPEAVATSRTRHGLDGSTPAKKSDRDTVIDNIMARGTTSTREQVAASYDARFGGVK